MSKNRLEAFSDGVIAILITIHVLELRVELYLPGHLLEQPSPFVAGSTSGGWGDLVGEPASAVLAVTGAIRDGLDWREQLRPVAGGAVWFCHVDGWGGLLHIDAHDGLLAWERFVDRHRAAHQVQRDGFPRGVCTCHRFGICEYCVFSGAVCNCGL